MILDLLNTKMSMDPPIERHHIERSHRLGRKLDHQDGRRDGAHARPRQRVIIVRFATERLRDEVFWARMNLKDHNKEHRDNQICLNDDLTARRAKLSFDARQLKKDKKIADTWTSYGKVMLQLVKGQVKEVQSSNDLKSTQNQCILNNLALYNKAIDHKYMLTIIMRVCACILHRLHTVYDIHNSPIYNVTLVTNIPMLDRYPFAYSACPAYVYDLSALFTFVSLVDSTVVI